MFLLQSSKQCYLLPALKCIKIGRSDTNNIALQSESSISRNHAEISIDREGVVCIKDLKSTYGTFINGEKVLPLQDNRIFWRELPIKLKFGACQAEYLLKRDSINFNSICFSHVSSDERQKITKLSNYLDFRITEKVSDASHIVMRNFISTEKGLIALCLGKTFVTPDYISAIETSGLDENSSSSFVASFKMPDPIKYLPDTCQDPGISNILVNLNVDTRRNSLFRNIVFIVFQSDQMTVTKNIIDSAGGSIFLIDEMGKDPTDIIRHTIKGHSNTVLIRPSKESLEGTIVEAALALKLSLVSVTDLGLAIIQVNQTLLQKPAIKRTVSQIISPSEISDEIKKPKIHDDKSAKIHEEKYVAAPRKKSIIETKIKKFDFNDDDDDDDDDDEGYGAFVQKFNKKNNINDHDESISVSSKSKSLMFVQESSEDENEKDVDVDVDVDVYKNGKDDKIYNEKNYDDDNYNEKNYDDDNNHLTEHIDSKSPYYNLPIRNQTLKPGKNGFKKFVKNHFISVKNRVNCK